MPSFVKDMNFVFDKVVILFQIKEICCHVNV